MPGEDRLIEISRTLGRIEGRFDGVDARFDHVNSRLDFQDEQRDVLASQLKEVLERPKLRRKAAMKWTGGALASIIAASFVAFAKGCIGK